MGIYVITYKAIGFSAKNMPRRHLPDGPQRSDTLSIRLKISNRGTNLHVMPELWYFCVINSTTLSESVRQQKSSIAPFNGVSFCMWGHAMLMSREQGRLNYERLTLEACKDLLLQRPPKLRTPCLSSKAHAMLTSMEWGVMCWCLKYEKLTVEVCKDPLWQRTPKLQTHCLLWKVRRPFSCEGHFIYNLSTD
ncbi:uncharacterized protein LOC119348529 [Triticum dicoccoides]|uniref:uncharacterized protein LOC119348529 n=1 Tax=Triticum dicoccoides TaxID=85692 RepID=UPI00188E94EE|nr:uncharacterized protein LOC119348529 [Triticum dicoccoides]